MTTILAIDTAAAACSAALWRDGTIVAQEQRAMTRGHAEALVPMMERVMTGMRYDRLSAIGVTVGPGAFTGLRIGLATARGLSLATGVPAIGVTSFAVAARMAEAEWIPADGVLVVALETKRADLYLQAFAAAGQAVTEPASVPAEKIATWLSADWHRIAVAGDATARLVPLLPDRVAAVQTGAAQLPDAAVVAALVGEGFPGMPQAGVVPPRPLYLRSPDVTLPKSGGRGAA